MKPVLAKSFRLEEELINDSDLVRKGLSGSVNSHLTGAK